MSITKEAPLFCPDYLISWDFRDPDFPCVSVCRLEREGEEPHVVARFLGSSHAASGVFSLLQLIDYAAEEARLEAERKVDAERLRQTFRTKPEEEG